MFACAIAWACIGKVDIHATAQGRIIPGGKTKTVSASELASVLAIHVQDGDHVEQGQALIDLDPTSPQADSSRLRREGLEQQVTAARLHAMLEGRTDITLPGVADSPGLQQLLAVNRQELQHKLADHRATIEALAQERQEKEAEKRGTQADMARLQQTVPLLEERAKMKQGLSDNGYVSRTEYLQGAAGIHRPQTGIGRGCPQAGRGRFGDQQRQPAAEPSRRAIPARHFRNWPRPSRRPPASRRIYSKPKTAASTIN